MVRVKAKDPDLGLGGKVNYRLVDDHNGKFIIDNRIGVIGVIGSLDREEMGIYNLTVVAHDDGLPPMSSSGILVVLILFLNTQMDLFPCNFQGIRNPNTVHSN